MNHIPEGKQRAEAWRTEIGKNLDDLIYSLFPSIQKVVAECMEGSRSRNGD